MSQQVVDEEQHSELPELPEQLNLKQHHPEQQAPRRPVVRSSTENSKRNSIKAAVNTVLASNKLSRRQQFAKTRSMSTKGREREHIKNLSLKAGTKHIYKSQKHRNGVPLQI